MRNCLVFFSFLALAACGKVDKFVDGGDDDSSSIDATTTDAPSAGQVNVVTHTRCCGTTGVFQAGVEVFVVGPDLTIGDRAVTNANGEATVDVTGGDSVTVVYPLQGNEHYLTTVARVAPGDTLTFGDGPQTDYSAFGAAMTVNWPAVAGVSYYNIYASCGGGYYAPTATYAFTRYAYCSTAPEDIVVTAYDNSGNVMAGVYQGSVTWVDNGTYTMPPLAAPSTLSMSMTGLPPEISYASLSVSALFGQLYGGGGYVGATPTGGAISGTSAFVAGATALQGNYYVDRNGFGGQSGNHVTAPGTSYAVTNPAFLPWLAEGIVSASARELTWIEDADGADPVDAISLQVEWYRTVGTPTLGGSTEYYYWRFILPPGTPNRLEFPPLPANLADLLVDTDNAYLNQLEMYDSADLSGWADVKALPEWKMTCPDCTQPGEAVPDIRYSSIGGGK